MTEDSGLPEGCAELLAEVRKTDESLERASGTGYGECSKESLTEDSGADEARMEAEMRAKHSEWEPIMEKVKAMQAERPFSTYDDFPEYVALRKDQRAWMWKWTLEAHGLGRRGRKIGEVAAMKDGLHRDRMLGFGLLPVEDWLTLQKRKDSNEEEEHEHEREDTDDCGNDCDDYDEYDWGFGDERWYGD